VYVPAYMELTVSKEQEWPFSSFCFVFWLWIGSTTHVVLVNQTPT
jgi:hypothetical protein